MAEDYYTTLGVSRGASASEIKSAFRTMAKKYHPDANPDDSQAADRFRECSMAYEVLSDPQKRSRYDQMGHAAFSQHQGGAGQQSGFSDFSDIFESFFSGFGGSAQARGGSRGTRGSDLRYNVSLSLSEAFAGKDQPLSYQRMERCEKCEGRGAKDPSSRKACIRCKGKGVLAMQQGPFRIEQTCSHCRGEGYTIADPCTACSGSGLSSKQHDINVRVPPGVDNGTRIRVNGEGNAGAGGLSYGDLYLFVSVPKHDLYRRNGNDLLFEMPLSIIDAAIGANIEVPTIEGTRVTVDIQPGIQTGTKLRVGSKGMMVLNGGGRRGDMIIQVRVETPVNLSTKQRSLFEELRKTFRHERNSPQAQGFLGKIKKFFSRDSSSSS